ncbi:MAG: cyclic nucleotide-binding domain-containing protein [Deltaproteobacteria bacterium]|nr:cyclic nucleotide-binding domain-containing protein [Deltaproteobacteria bacterium]MBI3294672.1 cyclic nucleotide-binding domain-containing protein [Deltaproteobacteria bacterium]
MTNELVGNLYLFRTLSADQIAWIGRLASTQRHTPGSVLFRQGDKANGLYIIKQGTITIQSQTQSEENKIATLRSGAHFGEISLLTGDVRTATATAIENSELLMLSYDRLKKLLEDQPLIGARVYKAMAQFLSGRLVQTTGDLTFVREKLRERA